MFYRIEIWNLCGTKLYLPQYRRSDLRGDWRSYTNGKKTGLTVHTFESWDEAYAHLEKHATPAALAVNFIGTF